MTEGWAMGFWRWSAGVVLVGAAVIWSCGKGTDSNQGSGGNVVTPPDAGNTPPPPPPPPDGGTDGGTDGGSAFIFVPPPPVDFPSPAPAGWSFYGPQNGGPHDVFGVTADQGGNIWVAGGEDGLFLMRAGTTTFQRFSMDDGLRPYGYMPDGSDPVGPKFLKVISVAGGPKCNGQTGCSGRVEHGHPAFNGLGASGGVAFITADYRGVALDPVTGDVWLGGVNRTTKLHYGAVTAQFPNGSRYDRFVTADVYTEGGAQTWPPPACPYSPCYA